MGRNGMGRNRYGPKCHGPKWLWAEMTSDPLMSYFRRRHISEVIGKPWIICSSHPLLAVLSKGKKSNVLILISNE